MPVTFRISLLRFFLGLALALGCSPQSAPKAQGQTGTHEETNAESTSTARPEAAQPNIVYGEYRKLNVAAHPGAQPRYVGRAKLVSDGGRVFLIETHEKGVRLQEELSSFEGKRVEIHAQRLEKHCHAWGDGQASTIVAPCLRGIESIELAPDQK